jgi:hypothetical protein
MSASGHLTKNPRQGFSQKEQSHFITFQRRRKRRRSVGLGVRVGPTMAASGMMSL